MTLKRNLRRCMKKNTRKIIGEIFYQPVIAVKTKELKNAATMINHHLNAEFRFSQQDAGNAPANASDVPNVAKESKLPSNSKILTSGGQEALDVDKVGESEIMRSCAEALHNLEAAAENALQSFYKLATVNIGEKESKRFERVHTIERKVQALAKLFHPSRNAQYEK